MHSLFTPVEALDGSTFLRSVHHADGSISENFIMPVTGFSGSNGLALLGAEQPARAREPGSLGTFFTDFRYRSQSAEQVRRIYKLQGADQNLGLLITEGPHQDTQDLQVPVFRWFNRFLKNDTGTVDQVATKFF